MGVGGLGFAFEAGWWRLGIDERVGYKEGSLVRLKMIFKLSQMVYMCLLSSFSVCIQSICPLPSHRILVS